MRYWRNEKEDIKRKRLNSEEEKKRKHEKERNDWTMITTTGKWMSSKKSEKWLKQITGEEESQGEGMFQVSVQPLSSSLCSYIKPYLCYQCIFMHFRDRPENPDSSTDLHHFLPPGIKIVEDVNVRQSVSLFLSLSLKIREFSRLLTNLVLLQSTSPRDTLLVTWKTYTCFRFPCKSFSCSLQIQEIIQGKNSKT